MTYDDCPSKKDGTTAPPINKIPPGDEGSSEYVSKACKQAKIHGGKVLRI